MDISQRKGQYPLPPGASEILGVEFSGHITALGPSTSANWSIGDEVLGLASGVSRRERKAGRPIEGLISMLIVPPLQGAYAEFIAVLETQILRKPQQLSWAEAASIPEAFITGESQVDPFGPSRAQR